MNPRLRFPALLLVAMASAIIAAYFPVIENNPDLGLYAFFVPLVAISIFVGIRKWHWHFWQQALLALVLTAFSLFFGMILMIVATLHLGSEMGSVMLFLTTVAPVATCAFFWILDSTRITRATGSPSSAQGNSPSSEPPSSVQLKKWLLASVGGIIVAVVTAAVLRWFGLN